MIESLGQYRILEQTASIGVCEVYRARDTRVGRTVAVRVLPDTVIGTQEQRARFLEDARTAAALSHPNIAALYEAGEDGSRVYLAGEYVQGQTLKAIVGGRPLNPRRALDVATQIADALAEAHAASVAHGALSADAVMVTPKGHAKILDVGVARWVSGTDLPSGGTESLEQRDIDALGIMLFEMLTGTRPSPDGSVARIIVNAIPRELDPVVARAIGEDGGYASAVALAADLRSVGAVLDARKEASTAASPPSAPRAPARAQTALAGRVAVVIALVALTALVLWYLRIV